jgi:hypothetical protein
MRGGADRLGELGLDQPLADGFGGLADTVTNIGERVGEGGGGVPLGLV